MEPSSSASFKRLRPTVNGSLRPSCLVDGCTADLSKCRDYHRRHKVCEVHSKTAVVTIRGHEQRFCQQCSRFHSLVEFDEGKRSCRKRLDGHNRRRRKPQPDSLSNLQGLRHIPFSIPQVFSTTSLSCSWLRAAKAEPDLSSELELNFSNGNGFFRGSLPHSYKGEEPFTFLQTNNSSVVSEVSISQPLLLDVNPSSSNGSSSREMFSNVLNQAIDSDRARSLLSSHPAETREIGLSPMVQSGPTSPLIPNLQYTGEQVGTILATDGSSNTDLHGHEMFPTGRSGSLSATGTHPSLSFSWD